MKTHSVGSRYRINSRRRMEKRESTMSLMQSKADTASAVTVSLSGWGLYLHLANKWVAEFMPLITAIGILGGLMVTIWYYRKCISQREKDQEIERQKLLDHMEQREHELAMARKGHERD